MMMKANLKRTKGLFIRSVKKFRTPSVFCFFDARWKHFALKIFLQQQRHARRTKIYNLQVNRA